MGEDDAPERVLEEGHTAGSYSHEVVDLASVRIARGWRKRGVKACEHKRLIISQTDRMLECDDCNRSVDPFDAVMMLTKHLEAMLASARSKQHKANEALAAVVTRRAAKALDKAWGRSMAPACPHCNTGLLPEDFADGAPMSFGRDYELARRKRKPPTS